MAFRQTKFVTPNRTPAMLWAMMPEYYQNLNGFTQIRWKIVTPQNVMQVLDEMESQENEVAEEITHFTIDECENDPDNYD